MGTFDYKSYIANNSLLEEFEDNGAEEKSFDTELMTTANGIASALKSVAKSDEAIANAYPSLKALFA